MACSFRIPASGIIRASRDIAIHNAFGKTLELKDRTPVDVEFVKGPDSPFATTIRIIRPHEFIIDVFGATETNIKDSAVSLTLPAFISALSYFSSPHMAAITAASRIMFRGYPPDIDPREDIPAAFNISIDGSPFSAKLYQTAGDHSWTHSLSDGKGSVIADVERNNTRLAAQMHQFGMFQELAKPFIVGLDGI